MESSTQELFVTAHDGTRIYVRRRSRFVSASEPTGAPEDGDSAAKSPRVTAILSDGIGCDGFIWKYLWDELPRFVDVAHWHYRGHGRSAPPAEPSHVTMDDLARDLDAVRTAVGGGPVVLFGHSMGCQVALEGYRLRPEGVKGLVLICGASGRVTHTFKGTNVLAQILPTLLERVERYPDITRAIVSRVPHRAAIRYALMMGEVDKKSIVTDDIEPYVKHMVDIDTLMFLRMLSSAGEHSALDLLPKVEVPALVIAGDRDSFTPPRYAEEMASLMPHAELMMTSGGTHVVPLERKELVATRIEMFLRGRVGV